MQLSFDAFHQTGDWPDVEKLQHQLVRENDSLDLYAVGDRIPSEIGTNPIRIDNHCQLTVAGVALCNGSDEEVSHFVSALRIAARIREFSADDYALTRSGETFKQPDGATVYIKQTVVGRYNVVVENARGVLGMVLKNIRTNKVAKLAENYSWLWTP
jgi:hypothetical protein